jgi:pyruvate ferredoxin oxidoreductase alpha subunit
VENVQVESVVRQEVQGLNGDEAVALAAKQCDVDVIAAYPITPQTIMVEKLSEYVANGEIQTEYVCTESEHSAMAACLAASATGARVFTATASAGLALMHEMLFVTSGCRAPVVMAVANRALSAPLNIHGDHSDSMAERDSGWVQIYCENAQEAYDSVIQAFRIAEHLDVQLPVMVGLDGFTLSHTLENVKTLPDDTVKKFVGIRKFPVVLTHEGKTAPYKLDPDSPMTMGPIALPNYYFEFKRQQEEAMRNTLEVIPQVQEEYTQLSDRQYGDGLLEKYALEDAEVAVVCLGSTAGTVKTVVDELRAQGIKAGLLRIRTYRPFPADTIAKMLEKAKAVAVMERSMSFGGRGGAVFQEVRHALYDSASRPLVANYIHGLGGRDTNPLQIRRVYEDLQKITRAKRVAGHVRFIGLRE